MKHRANLSAIVALAAFAGLAQSALAVPVPAAEACKADAATITSSTITSAGWYVSGSCLQNVTNAVLAGDDGAGFEELAFTLVTNTANPAAQPSLLIAPVRRTGPGISAIPLGQYLLQIKKCPNARPTDKCKVLDEKYLFVPIGDAPPV